MWGCCSLSNCQTRGGVDNYSCSRIPVDNLESPIINSCFWTELGSQSTWRKPGRAKGEHPNSKQKEPRCNSQRFESTQLDFFLCSWTKKEQRKRSLAELIQIFESSPRPGWLRVDISTTQMYGNSANLHSSVLLFTDEEETVKSNDWKNKWWCFCKSSIFFMCVLLWT